MSRTNSHLLPLQALFHCGAVNLNLTKSKVLFPVGDDDVYVASVHLVAIKLIKILSRRNCDHSTSINKNRKYVKFITFSKLTLHLIKPATKMKEEFFILTCVLYVLLKVTAALNHVHRLHSSVIQTTFFLQNQKIEFIGKLPGIVVPVVLKRISDADLGAVESFLK